MNTMVKTTIQDCGKELPIQFPILNIMTPTGIQIGSLILGVTLEGTTIVSIPYLGNSQAV